MVDARIAVLFDAENVSCAFARRVLRQLHGRGEVPIRRAVGDFSLGALAGWMDCARENGIELVLQPGLGKGKNGADIRLAIEAMDIAHQRLIDTVALVTHDRDFTPLALRLRHAGLAVWGFAHAQPHEAFRAACSSFEVTGHALPAAIAPPSVAIASTLPTFGSDEVIRLRHIARIASRDGPILPIILSKAIIAAEPELATRLSGQGKFLKTLVALGIVQRVGAGADLQVRAA